VLGMVRALRQRNVDASIATTTVMLEAPVPLETPVDWQGAPVRFFRHQTPPHFTFSWPLTRWLRDNMGQYDVAHIHTLFSYATTPASYYARKYGVPYIIRPLGTLDVYPLQKSALRKRIYLRLLDRRNLEGAASIHFTSELEQREAGRLGLSAPGVVIPIGVEELAPATAADVAAFRSVHGLGDNFLLLTLCRLDDIKGLEVGIEAVVLLTSGGASVRWIIGGSGDAAYTARLQALIKSRGMQGRIRLVGTLAGAGKAAALAAADAFLLPSLHENFGVAVAEAMAAGLPVIVSEHVGLASKVAQHAAGVVTPATPAALAAAIASLAGDSELRHRMGEAARALARSEFGWAKIAAELENLYRRLLTRQA
jgi:glycosyltransferase involved in cell wall biosynthesis